MFLVATAMQSRNHQHNVYIHNLIHNFLWKPQLYSLAHTIYTYSHTHTCTHTHAHTHTHTHTHTHHTYAHTTHTHTQTLPEKSGYLNKMDPKQKRWSRRWFVLRGSELKYYRTKDAFFGLKRPKGVINLDSWCKLSRRESLEAFEVCTHAGGSPLLW